MYPMRVKKVPMVKKKGPYTPYFLSQRDCEAWYLYLIAKDKFKTKINVDVNLKNSERGGQIEWFF